jgi:signal transduction histidine kinase/ligand-binding sensor domain-containing protein
VLDAGDHEICPRRLLRIAFFGLPPGIRARSIHFAVCLLILSSSGVWALESMSKPVPKASVNPQPIRMPIVDGADLRYTRLSTSDGLSQTRVDQVVQDNQGFIWLNTLFGLDRYDGYNFKLFVHDPRNPGSLSGAEVETLFKDRDGAIWAVCNKFLNKLDPETETFTRYPIPVATRISQDSHGMLWLATREGLYRFNPVTGVLHRYIHDPNDPSSLSSSDVISSKEDRSGRFWVSSAKGLDEFDRGTGKVTLHIPLNAPYPDLSFYEDRLGTFWIFDVDLSRNGLAAFDPKRNMLTYYSFYEAGTSTGVSTGVTAMLEDRNGTLWLATHHAGLLKFDRAHQRLIRYRNKPGDADSIPQDNVENLFEDREGSIWAGLGSKGVIHFSTIAPPFDIVTYLPRPDNGADPFVGAIYEDHQRVLWIGTPAALYGIDRKADHYYSYHRTGTAASETDVIAINEDAMGNIWVGTYGHGLLRLDRKTGRFQKYVHNPADPHSLSNNIVSRLLVDHNGALWVATFDGLDRFDAATGRFTVYKPDSEVRNLAFLELVEDRKGAFWLGTEFSGLYRFDPATGHFINYEFDVNRPGTLSDNRVNSVHFDNSGTMWVGTQNGLNKFDPKTSTFTIYTRRDGLPGNVVGCILEDDHRNLWMSTNNGVAKFNLQTETAKSYSTADGLPGPDLTGWGACSKGLDEEMFFGGFSGATSLYPSRVVDATDKPPVVLTEFLLSGTPVQIGGGSPLSKSISYTTRLTLSHKQDIFSLAFSALSYLNPGANRYRYKLEGLDERWYEVGSDQRVATYTTLPTGEYTFRVQGATSRGPWAEPGAAVVIKILPPWWSTLWFRAAYVALILFSLWCAYRYRLLQVHRQFNMRIEERVGERTRIARELHDTLLQGFQGLMFHIQAARNLLPDRPAEALEALDTAMNRGDDAIAEGRGTVEDLRSSNIIDQDLERALSALGEELLPGNGNLNSTAFGVLVEGKPRRLDPVFRDEVYRIAREALRNAFHHSQAEKIEAEMTYGESKFVLRIRDNGNGIDPMYLDQGMRAGHWGLPGMRERARKIGGQLEVWSEHRAGTEVEFTVPASVAYEGSAVRRAFWLLRTRKGSQDNGNQS